MSWFCFWGFPGWGKGVDGLVRMTIGWVEEFVRDGEVVDGFETR